MGQVFSLLAQRSFLRFCCNISSLYVFFGLSTCGFFFLLTFFFLCLHLGRSWLDPFLCAGSSLLLGSHFHACLSFCSALAVEYQIFLHAFLVFCRSVEMGFRIAVCTICGEGRVSKKKLGISIDFLCGTKKNGGDFACAYVHVTDWYYIFLSFPSVFFFFFSRV